MILRIILFSLIALIPTQCQKKEQSLMGYMTDVQTWVHANGVLTSHVEQRASIDLSASDNPVNSLQQKLRVRIAVIVKYLSLARCGLSKIPPVFKFRNPGGENVSDTIEYLTLYGNHFQDISSPGTLYDVIMNATHARERIVGVGYQRNSNAVWSAALREIYFPRLKELDLRYCSIQVLSANIFEGMPSLLALYLGENQINYIDGDAFVGLSNLIHLDISMNLAYDDTKNIKPLFTDNIYVFEPLKNLSSLDFSFTKLTHQNMMLLKSIGPSLTRLSLCGTGLNVLDDDVFNHTSLRILDVSWNSGILSSPDSLRATKNTLEILFAKKTGLKSVNVFKDFVNLQVLSIPHNEITSFGPHVASTLVNLKVLDLESNRLTTWFGSNTFSSMSALEVLILRENNINIISEEMINDVARVKYLAIGGNFIVCNCHARDFIYLAQRNEPHANDTYFIERLKLYNDGKDKDNYFTAFHRGFIEYNTMIWRRLKVHSNCSGQQACYEDLQEDIQGDFLLLDFHPDSYMCLRVPESESVHFSEVPDCNRQARKDYMQEMEKSWNMLYILLILPILLIAIGIGFMFRRNIRYFYITMRNSALLSVINKNDVLDDAAIFHYDVFVSYCNEDRHWVLEHLLPHLEKQCSISACLHERDFQVGHSILENIVSCMDRSRSIMLVISRKFLLSQWCQFEMHLAQHRLLETRREDLTLVLLEEVPRRLRPNTLHYLMLTKTYIVWPKDENERPLFWRRLKKTIVNIKMKQIGIEGVSIA